MIKWHKPENIKVIKVTRNRTGCEIELKVLRESGSKAESLSVQILLATNCLHRETWKGNNKHAVFWSPTQSQHLIRHKKELKIALPIKGKVYQIRHSQSHGL